MGAVWSAPLLLILCGLLFGLLVRMARLLVRQPVLKP